MITFSRVDNKVKVHVQHGIWYSDEGFSFELSTEYNYQAELLLRQFQNNTSNLMEDLKKHYYNEGWKHAKSKKVAKRTWFPGNFKKS